MMDSGMDVMVWIVVGAVVFFAFVAVHELGHAVAARFIGVPPHQVAVRLTEWPAHVALEADGQWHRPGTAGYQDAYARHDQDLRWLGVFVASGFIAQTAVMVLLVIGCFWLGVDGFGGRLVRISIVVNGLYLAGDAAATVAARSPAGDMSSLLRHAPVVAVATLGLLAVGHVAAWSVG